jgi:hypothetical protein
MPVAMCGFNPRRFGNLFSPGKVPASQGMLAREVKKVFEILLGKIRPRGKGGV